MAKTRRPAGKPVPTTRSELAKRFRDYPALSVLERKLDDPNDPGSLPILLTDDPDPCCGDFGHAFNAKPGALRCSVCRVPFRKWYLRWVNLGEQDRGSVVRGRGYVKVQAKELANLEDVMGLDADGEAWVTRGDKKTEVLYKRPFAYHVEIKREQLRKNNARMTGRQLKKDLVASADKGLGDEGAQTLSDHLHVEEFSRKKSTLAEEIGADKS